MAAALCALLPACIDDSPAPATEPEAFVREILLADGVARHVGRELHDKLLQSVADKDLDLAKRSLHVDFRGRFPGPGDGKPVTNHGLELTTLSAESLPVLDRDAFLAVLEEHLQDSAALERGAFDTDRFYLGEARDEARGRAEIRLAGSKTDGGRYDLRVECDIELSLHADFGWQIRSLEAHGGTRILGAAPRFIESSGAMGFTINESPRNRGLLQDAIDSHRTLTLGGLTALDWNDDGHPDLIATAERQYTQLFLNDGIGGFRRGELPVQQPSESSNFYLWIDLDADGREELVGSTPLRYSGGRAHLA
ncbi:MAG: hypothetical protein ACI841_005225, partial [Planctomycetota bacterium]